MAMILICAERGVDHFALLQSRYVLPSTSSVTSAVPFWLVMLRTLMLCAVVVPPPLLPPPLLLAPIATTEMS